MPGKQKLLVEGHRRSLVVRSPGRRRASLMGRDFWPPGRDHISWLPGDENMTATRTRCQGILSREQRGSLSPKCWLCL